MSTAFDAAFSGKPKTDVVTDDKPEVETPEVEETEEVEAKETAAPSAAKVEEKPDKSGDEPEQKARDESGKFVKTVPHEALHAERKKREALETRLAELEAKDKKPPTSVLEDEDKAFNERLGPALQAERARFFDFTVEMAKEKPNREDYDEIFEFMVEEVKKDSSLRDQIFSAKNPGEAVYQLGKTRRELAEVGNDLTKYRDHVTAAERKKLDEANTRIKALEVELEQVRTGEKQRKAIPQSLNSEQSASQKTDEFSGPTPLKDVLPKL